MIKAINDFFNKYIGIHTKNGKIMETVTVIIKLLNNFRSSEYNGAEKANP